MDTETLNETLLVGLVILFVVGLFASLYIIIPIHMAVKRGRTVLGWLLVFWLISPLFGILLLAALGNSDEKERRLQEERMKQWEEAHPRP